MQKSLVLLGALDGMSQAEFKNMYLHDHTAVLLKDDMIKRYVANIIEEPSQELINAGWGWGGKDDTGIRAIDEIWTEDGSVLEHYGEDTVIIGAYNVDEVVLRPCFPELPLGERSPWIKRMGLLKCLQEQRPEDFFAYWEHIHGPNAMMHHIGAGCYVQHHFKKTLKEAPIAWNGSMSLCYWNIDAFRYGHFSKPDSAAAIKADGAHFMEIFLALLASEYVIRR